MRHPDTHYRGAVPVLGLALCVVLSRPVLATACTHDDIQALCAPAAEIDTPYPVRCDIDFKTLDCRLATGNPNVITRSLVLEGADASGLRLDFNHALISAVSSGGTAAQTDSIEIRSRQRADGSWSRPEDIRIANARVRGSIRVYGMGRNGESPPVRDSSHRPGHRQRIRNAAPRDIRFDGIHLTGIGRNLLYLAPGVTRVAVARSQFDGHSARVAIYLDTETQAIILTDNIIATRTGKSGVLGFYDRGWPQLALDGSSLAQIRGNRFVQPSNGGIYLYRNCGEGGTIRLGTPSHNEIVGNTFVYRSPNPPRDPAIFIGSRNYDWLEEHWPGSHCDDDRRMSGRAIGSALSNGDHARNNRIEANRFLLGAEDSALSNGTFDNAESTPANRYFIINGNAQQNTGNRVVGNVILKRPSH